MESPIADEGLDALSLDVRLLCARLQRQVLDGFGIHGTGAHQSRANATYICVLKGPLYNV